MKLNLKRPLAFLDLETTGTDIGKDRIVELAIVKLMPDGQIHGLAKPNPQFKHSTKLQRQVPKRAPSYIRVQELDVDSKMLQRF